MKSLFLFVLTCFISLAWGQIPAPTFRWAVPISGALELYDMEVTPAGDVYVFGYFKDYICFDTTWAHCQYSHGKEDYFLAKYNQKGELVWGKPMGGRKMEGHQGANIYWDKDYNAYITGNLYSDSLYVGDSLIVLPANDWSGTIWSVDKDGRFLWLQQWRGNIGSIQYCIPAGDNLYLFGAQNADMPFLDTSLPYVGNGNRQYFIGVYSLIQESLLQFLPMQEADTSYAISGMFTNALPLSNGNLLVSGRFETSLSVPPLLFEENNFPGGATYLMLLDPELQPIWGEVYSSGGNPVNNFVFDKSNYYLNYGLQANDTLEVFGNVMVWDTMGIGEIAAIKAPLGQKPLWKKQEDELGNHFLGRLNKGNFFTAEYASEGKDTLYYYGNPIMRFDTLESNYAVRTDTNLTMIWNRHLTSYKDQIYDRFFGFGLMDSSGYLYGWGRMKQFSIYIDSILVKPLFATMGLYGEQFICSTTRDSFPPAPEPPPPPVDTLPPSGTVYPNPFGEVVNLINEFQAGAITFEVIDTKGSLVWNQSLKIPQGRQLFTFDLSSLASGIYILRVKQQNKQSFYKIIKTT